jgi:hypothetical protein
MLKHLTSIEVDIPPSLAPLCLVELFRPKQKINLEHFIISLLIMFVIQMSISIKI